jgi:hypothetical protein
MSSLEKLKARFLACEGRFPFSDVTRLLEQLGYCQLKAGKTGGSRRKFFNNEIDHLICFHEPHGSEMKAYAVREIREALQQRGLL